MKAEDILVRFSNNNPDYTIRDYKKDLPVVESLLIKYKDQAEKQFIKIKELSK